MPDFSQELAMMQQYVQAIYGQNQDVQPQTEKSQYEVIGILTRRRLVHRWIRWGCVSVRINRNANLKRSLITAALTG